MKIGICILNYVDTIDVLIDGLKIDVKKLSLFSKAEFEHTIETGVHEITIVKKSGISERNWKKNVFFDWMSCLFGVPDWTLAEKALDKQKHSMVIMVNIEQDMYISFELTEHGIELLDSHKNILDITTQTETSEIAERRIKNAYLIPIMVLALLIETSILVVGIFFITNNEFLLSTIIFALAIFWACLIIKIIKDRGRF